MPFDAFSNFKNLKINKFQFMFIQNILLISGQLTQFLVPKLQPHPLYFSSVRFLGENINKKYEGNYNPNTHNYVEESKKSVDLCN